MGTTHWYLFLFLKILANSLANSNYEAYTIYSNYEIVTITLNLERKKFHDQPSLLDIFHLRYY